MLHILSAAQHDEQHSASSRPRSPARSPRRTGARPTEVWRGRTIALAIRTDGSVTRGPTRSLRFEFSRVCNGWDALRDPSEANLYPQAMEANGLTTARSMAAARGKPAPRARAEFGRGLLTSLCGTELVLAVALCVAHLS